MRLRSTARANPALLPESRLAPDVRRIDDRAIADMALAEGYLTQEGLSDIEARRKATGENFSDAAVTLGLLDDGVAALLAVRQGGFPLLAAGDTRIDPLVVTAFDPAAPYAAQIRAVRAKLRASAAGGGKDGPLRLAVISIDAGDEAAILTANLAVILAQMDGQTMVVDVDMGHPSLDRLFRMANQSGLAEQLAGSAVLLPATRTAIDRLWLMTAGKASRSAASLVAKGPLAETVSGWGMADTTMLFYLVEQPGEPTPFGSILAGFDAVVTVARRGRTTIADMRRIIDDLDRHGVPIAGSVVA
jgi:protein-tyrosine kinase